MDSMRSLNTSLPRTSPIKNEQPEQLLQAFKDAALSVTKLYKTAATDQTRARSEGYQDALDDLLSFLDHEDIGLSDGEGWRIRRWATERLDGRDAVSQHGDSDEEREQPERASSPVMQRTQSSSHLSTRSASPTRAEPILSDIPEEPANIHPPSSTFTFQSTYPYPQDSEMHSSESNNADKAREQSVDTSLTTSHGSLHTPQSVSAARPNRRNLRQTAPRHTPRISGNIGRGPGQKRKINFGDFFDISNVGHHRDGSGSTGSGGGKRGRFV